MSRSERPRAGLRFASAASQVRSDVSLAVLDAVLIAAAYVAVLILRLDGVVAERWWLSLRLFLPVAAGIHLASNWVWGLYGQMWRHASILEARRIVLAGASSTLALGLFF